MIQNEIIAKAFKPWVIKLLEANDKVGLNLSWSLMSFTSEF
jgi:hypothetical protein